MELLGLYISPKKILWIHIFSQICGWERISLIICINNVTQFWQRCWKCYQFPPIWSVSYNLQLSWGEVCTALASTRWCLLPYGRTMQFYPALQRRWNSAPNLFGRFSNHQLILCIFNRNVSLYIKYFDNIEKKQLSSNW